MDFMRFYGVGGERSTFRRQLRAVSDPNLQLWLSFYLCDEWKSQSQLQIKVYLWRGIRIEFHDIFGLVWYSVSIYKSQGYIVTHHQYEDTLHLDKVSWEGQEAKVDEYRSEIAFSFVQDNPDAPDGTTRSTTVKVILNGRRMPEYTFQGHRGLEVIQTVKFDCVSYSFDCAEVTEVAFSGLGPRAADWSDKYVPKYLDAVSALKDVIDSQPPPTPQIQEKSSKLVVCVGIMSTPGQFDKRMAQRETWLRHPLVLSGHFMFKFFLPATSSAVLQAAMDAEANAFGDIVFLPESEVYLTINYKTVEILRYFTSIPELHEPGVSYVIGKTDDDVYVNVAGLHDYLMANQRALEGFTIFCQTEKQNRVDFWFWPIGETKEYSQGIPPYPAGTFYIVSASLALGWMQLADTVGLVTHPMEDRQTGIWAVQFERDTKERVNWVRFDGLVNECKPDALVVHHALPEELRCLHKKFLTHNRVVCC